jgi:hypothetical protein
MRAAVVLLVLALAGCATPTERIVYKPVNVPVPYECLKRDQLPPADKPRPIDQIDVKRDNFMKKLQGVLLNAEQDADDNLNLRSALAGCAG